MNAIGHHPDCSRSHHVPASACHKVVSAVGLLALAMLLPGSARASDAPKDFSFGLTTLLWTSGVEGDVGIRGITADVDASLIDILDSVIGLQTRLDLRNGRWGLFVDGLYQRLDGEGMKAATSNSPGTPCCTAR